MKIVKGKLHITTCQGKTVMLVPEKGPQRGNTQTLNPEEQVEQNTSIIDDEENILRAVT
jgi:hypothetical protein